MVPVVCKTDNPDGSQGLSILMVDIDTPGVTRSRPIETLHRGCATECEFFFDDVQVGRERLLGGREGGGFKQVMGVLNDMRVAEGARYLAAAELAFAVTLEFVSTRKAFGQRILDFQNTQFRLAEIKTELAVGRAFIDQTLAKIKRGTAHSGRRVDGQDVAVRARVPRRRSMPAAAWRHGLCARIRHLLDLDARARAPDPARHLGDSPRADRQESRVTAAGRGVRLARRSRPYPQTAG